MNSIAAVEMWDSLTGYANPASEVAEARKLGRTLDEHAAELARLCLASADRAGWGDTERPTIADVAEAFEKVLNEAPTF